MKSKGKILSIFLCAVFVAACSGGDGGSADPIATPTPTPASMADIDETSAATIAGGVYDSVFASSSFGDVVGGGGSGSLVGATQFVQPRASAAQSSAAPGMVPGVAIPGTTTQCAVAGSVTVTGQVAVPSTLSATDRLNLQYADCDDGDGRILNGIFEILVNRFSGDFQLGMVDLGATVTFDGMEIMEGLERTALNGAITMDLDTSMPPVASVSLYGSMSVSDNTDSATLSDFRSDRTLDASTVPEAYTLAASGALTSTLFDGQVTYSTPVPFQGYVGQYAYQGELLVIGANGASVRMIAVDEMSVRLEIDPGDGSGIITIGSSWPEVSNASITGGTGIMGTVLRGPIYPGPEIEGQINEEPFSASFRVLNSAQVVAQFESDANGEFSVSLPPGDYTIVADASAPIMLPENQEKPVTVPANGVAEVVLRFDTGLY